MEAQHLFNAWATYRFPQGLLKGLGIGLGANAASELLIANSEITGTFVLPGQVIYNSSLFYELKDIRLAVNINNVADEEYYKGWSTINPQKPRNVSAGMTYGF